MTRRKEERKKKKKIQKKKQQQQNNLKYEMIENNRKIRRSFRPRRASVCILLQTSCIYISTVTVHSFGKITELFVLQFRFVVHGVFIYNKIHL